MIRFACFIVIALNLASQPIDAQQPSRILLVAADQAVADAILPLCGRSHLTILVRDRRDSHQAIEARALRLLDASIFVMGHEPSHESLPIFEERFRNHGVQIVRLPASRRLAQQKKDLRNDLGLALQTRSRELP